MTKNKNQKKRLAVTSLELNTYAYIPSYSIDSIWNCQISRPILDLNEDELEAISELAYRACELN